MHFSPRLETWCNSIAAARAALGGDSGRNRMLAAGSLAHCRAETCLVPCLCPGEQRHRRPAVHAWQPAESGPCSGHKQRAGAAVAGRRRSNCGQDQPRARPQRRPVLQPGLRYFTIALFTCRPQVAGWGGLGWAGVSDRASASSTFCIQHPPSPLPSPLASCPPPAPGLES